MNASDHISRCDHEGVTSLKGIAFLEQMLHKLNKFKTNSLYFDESILSENSQPVFLVSNFLFHGDS